jgi:uncharacterized protein with PQ loop repeat
METDTYTVAYSATGISILARFIFMYLLYTKKSTNNYSLLFCIMNIVSSTLWINYSVSVNDMPIMIRGSSDLVLFSISTAYILNNKYKLYTQVQNDNVDNIDNKKQIVITS